MKTRAVISVLIIYAPLCRCGLLQPHTASTPHVLPFAYAPSFHHRPAPTALLCLALCRPGSKHLSTYSLAAILLTASRSFPDPRLLGSRCVLAQNGMPTHVAPIYRPSSLPSPSPPNSTASLPGSVWCPSSKDTGRKLEK